MTISAAVRPIALALVASLALAGAADAASKGKSKHKGYQGGYVHTQPYYGYPHVTPSGSYNPDNGTYRNFRNLPRDTRNEGFNNRYGFDFGRSNQGR